MSTLGPQANDRVLATMAQDGSRRWLTPKLAKGPLLRRRQSVAYALIGLLTALPLIQINGKPAVLLNVPDRQFTLLGYTFLPTDTVLLALLLVSWFATIFLTTALVGRAWCGWTCPQTVYMEFVYRPIERLCLGRSGVGGKPKAALSPLRYVAMHGLFVLISLAITHTLLSYFVGASQLRSWITSTPFDHPWAFGVIAVSTLGVWYNFVFFREQMCTIACPYGRFQSVLFDPQSKSVRYNEPRGEPRRKLQSARRQSVSLPTFKPEASDCKREGANHTCENCSDCSNATPGGVPSFNAVPDRAGDCIDCSMCVQVCPTGIDIRDGVQLECVNCTQCIDACNTVMRKIGRPEGLIGFYSQTDLEGTPTRMIRPRVVLYSIISVGFLAAMLVLIATKKPFDATLTRNIGLPFFTTPQGQVENVMRLTLRNRTGEVQIFVIESKTPNVSLLGDAASITVPAHESVMQPVNLVADPATIHGMMTASLSIRNQRRVERVLQCQLYGPGVGQ